MCVGWMMMRTGDGGAGGVGGVGEGEGEGGLAWVMPLMQSDETITVVAAECRVQMPPALVPAEALKVKFVQVGKVAHSWQQSPISSAPAAPT